MMWYSIVKCVFNLQHQDLPYFGLYKIILPNAWLHSSFFIPEISPLLTTALNPVSQLVGDLLPVCHEPYQENIIINLK